MLGHPLFATKDAPNGAVTSFTCDPLGREGCWNTHRLIRKNSDGSLASWVEQIFDSRERLAETRLPHDGGQAASLLDLDANGNPTTRTDAKGQDETNVYDPVNRLTRNVHRLGA